MTDSLADLEAAEPNSWDPVDLWPYLNGTVKRAAPTVGLMRDDGLRMLYPGKEHSVIGEMEAAKSWLCLGSAAAELKAGNHVLYIHFEEADPADTVERLRALDPVALTPAVIAERFHFVGPERRVLDGDLKKLLETAPTLVIFDGVNEAMSQNGWDIYDADGAATFRRKLVKECTKAGAATLAADHVVKDKEQRGRSPFGSVHKGNGVTGALILLENVKPFGRGEHGFSKVYVTKDRPGHLRRHGSAEKLAGKTYMGNLHVDDERIGGDWLELWFSTPKDQPSVEQPDRSTEDDRRVLAVVRSLADREEEASITTIRAHVGLRHERVVDAVTRLLSAGQLSETKGSRNKRLLHPVVNVEPFPVPVPLGTGTAEGLNPAVPVVPRTTGKGSEGLEEVQDEPPAAPATSARHCSQCGEELYLTISGREICERCRLDNERQTP